jgi:hypothetical protein
MFGLILLALSAPLSDICEVCLDLVETGMKLTRKRTPIQLVNSTLYQKCRDLDLYYRTGCFRLVKNNITDIYNGASNRFFSPSWLCFKNQACAEDETDTGTSSRNKRDL